MEREGTFGTSPIVEVEYEAEPVFEREENAVQWEGSIKDKCESASGPPIRAAGVKEDMGREVESIARPL